MAGIYKACAGLRVGGLRWSSFFKSSKAFGLCGYGTTFGGPMLRCIIYTVRAGCSLF